jgi:(p)ppGpp synthase/HD superfamily hydrolase
VFSVFTRALLAVSRKFFILMGIPRHKKLLRKLGVKARSKLRARAVAKKEVQAATAEQPNNPLQAILRAASFAARKHHGQMRGDNLTPYFSHVTRVTLVLVHLFGVDDEDTITAALLHDTLEDTATDYDEIAHIFGDQVASYVVLLTKNPLLPKTERERDYRNRLSTAPEQVIIAKLADLYDNLSDRINSHKLRKTAATAERLLEVFSTRVKTPTGRSAHEKLSALLEEIKLIRPAETANGADAEGED